jgi:hypothetical protein
MNSGGNRDLVGLCLESIVEAAGERRQQVTNWVGEEV